MFTSARWVGRLGAVLALAVVLTAPQVSLAQKRAVPAAKKSGASPKQDVRRLTVLAFEGDSKGRVRAQVESALRKARGVRVIPLKQYTAAAAKERLRGASARAPSSLPVVAPRLALDAAVTGEVGRTVQVRLLDASGREVFSQESSFQKGRIPPAQLRGLVKELVLAATTKLEPEPQEEPEKTAEPEPEPVQPVEPEPVRPAEPEPVPPEPVAQPEPTEPGDAPRVETPDVVTPPVVVEAPSAPMPAVEAEVPASTEPEAPEARSEEGSHPPVVRVFLGGTTTWRRYCARPGVASCGEFGARPEEERAGDTVDFDTSAPYLGVGLEVELLPLARSETLLRGLGFVVGMQRAYATATVRVSSPSGETPRREVVTTDTTLTALAMYRYYFERGGDVQPLLGYVGLRGGVTGRAFDVDESAASPLLGTHRLYPVVGLEVSVPLVRWLRIEGAGHLYFSPKPGQWLQDESDLDLEVRELGGSVSSSGWSAELGLAGDIWGPVGYSVRFRRTQYKDTFTGRGVRTGWTNGGVAEETYHGLQWGLTAAW